MGGSEDATNPLALHQRLLSVTSLTDGKTACVAHCLNQPAESPGGAA
jgi:hypothetical protein